MNYEISRKNIKVNISLLTGDIELKGTSRTDISVDFDELRKGTAEEIFDIKFENNELVIAQKNKKLSQFINMESFPVSVEVPENCILEAVMDSLKGDISVSGLSGLKGKVSSKKGDISVSEIKEIDADISIISGDISVSGSNGSLSTSAISGDTSVSGGNFTALKIRSVSGDVSVSCELDLKEDLSINSVTGDVSVNIVKFSGDAGINISSVSGDVDISGDKPADEKIKISQVKGEFAKFNKAFFQDSLKPMIKNLKEHLKDVTSHGFKSEVHSAKKDNQNISQILNMVSEGKITADEAEKLISALK
ncbi:MAG: DUF4097 family beta strand repeat-containing protein [Candidatus Delongbacteria bacterium]|nr:DUF4097 family beta strand repeat-containing protein [Candidatus Delongbacteria bacterium]